MRFPILSFLAVALVLTAPRPAWPAPLEVEARPVPLDAADPTRERVGKLRYLGGLALSSPESRFGGFSGLAVSADGERLIAVSDRGFRLEAKIVYDADGRLAGLAGADLGSLAGETGRPLSLPAERDSEGIAAGPSGEIVVSFERDHRFLRYLPGQAVPERLPPPEELSSAPANGGVEGITFLEDGRILAIAEELMRGERAVGWISDEKSWSPLAYLLRDGFRVTGLATLPSGDVLALERYYTLRVGVAARVRRIPAGAIRPGAELDAELVVELRAPLTLDNMEGIDARLDPKTGRTLVYLVSDDNYSVRQRTLLMMFELAE